MTDSTIGHTTAVDAAVTNGHDVQLFHPSGRTFLVPAGDVNDWLREGYRLSQVDLDAQAHELEPLLDAIGPAIQEAVQGVLSDGSIDTADTAALVAAQTAVDAFTTAWSGIVRDIYAAYPVRQGEAVTLIETTPDRGDVEHAVDPGQVDLYLERDGWRKPKGSKT